MATKEPGLKKDNVINYVHQSEIRAESIRKEKKYGKFKTGLSYKMDNTYI